ncbi:MAG: flagellar hook-associated protein FlgL [Gammaproteobacteria bacterium]|nr:flagellar hook-associated protein FlgL [Gammaproteobacteria bacterium]MDH5728288.1 flagellar hook-associated protein FlgL [Gammaproteobacteria bacterium]
MRVSTLNIAQTSLSAMLKQQAQLNRTQLQISTGTKLIAPSDNPYGASRMIDLNEAVTIFDQYSENANYAQNRLSLEESILGNVTDALQRVRVLVIQGNNDTQTNESREFLGQEVSKILEQLMSLANSTDAANEYLFGGYKGKTQPFTTDGLGNFTYNGDDGYRYLKVGSATEVAVGDPGKEVFQEIRRGNGRFYSEQVAGNTGTGIIDTGQVTGSYVPDTYTITFGAGNYTVSNTAGVIAAAVPYNSGSDINSLKPFGIQTTIVGQPQPGDTFQVRPSAHKDLFSIVYDLEQALKTPAITGAELTEFHNIMGHELTNLDQAMGNILSYRARVGARLNTIEKQVNINGSFTIEMKASLSGIKDLDYAQAVTDLNLQLVGLQAAQQAYTKIQGLSMFNYIR